MDDDEPRAYRIRFLMVKVAKMAEMMPETEPIIDMKIALDELIEILDFGGFDDI